MSNELYDRLEPWGYGEGLETPVHVYGINVGVPLLAIALLMVRWWRSRRDAARARVAEDGATASAGALALTPGPRVVRGKVRMIESGDAAVRVSVFQDGTERENKSSWTTTWTESGRRIDTSPFELELAGGGLLRVEPGASPRLMDTLGPWRRTGNTTRVAEAKLESGEEVFVSGQLTRGHDSIQVHRSGEGLVMRAPASSPMLLSTVGLSKPHRARAQRAARWIKVLTAAAVIAQILVVQYHVAVFFGETRPATIERLSVEEKSRKGRKYENYFVTYRVHGAAQSTEDEVDDEDFAKLEEGAVVPAHVSPLQTTIGPHPTLHGLLGLLPSFGLVVLGVISVWLGHRRTAWYEIKLVDAVSGRLGKMGSA